jgi:preprotein translocase subunit YajC
MPDSAPLVLAVAQAPGQQPQVSPLVSLFPYAVILLIFYFLVLQPMRKRQKKVQEFQSSLKVGDRVITTGGIYGLVTKVAEGTVQLQIADKVKIEVARAAVGGYQGQEPVVPPDSGSAS